MFVIAVVKKDGATKFIDGQTRKLTKGWEMRIDDVHSMEVDVETLEDFGTMYLVTVNTYSGVYHTFDAEYWDVRSVSECDPLFED